MEGEDSEIVISYDTIRLHIHAGKEEEVGIMNNIHSDDSDR